MSKAEVERFVSDVRTDPKLQAALRGKFLDGPGLLALARAHGYDVTAEDVEAHVRAGSRELSEEELDSAAGGTSWLVNIIGPANVAAIQPR